ncbi:MAG TPA: hypothetical protein VNN19_02410 [bacterium]|nr:hypothetical protein [bacterium]
MKLVAALIVVLAAAAPAAAVTQQVVVSVPAMQVLEGQTTLSLAHGTAVRAGLTVKSNVPWTLVAAAESGGRVAVRAGQGPWVLVEGDRPVLRGGRGVHVVRYEARAEGTGPARLTMILTPAVEATIP